MTTEFDQHRPFADAIRSPPQTKPGGGARILSFFLQAIVMATALLLFFLFAGVAAVILLHLFVVGRALRRGRHLSPNLSYYEVEEERVPVGFTVEELRKMEWFEYSMKRKTMTSADCCAICLESFRVGEKCRKLPKCGHDGFHKDCVDRWLSNSRACPICRNTIM